LTTDEVNEALAMEMTHACGVALEHLAPKEGPPDASYDAVLIDWDHWPSEHREKFLAGLHHGLLPWRVAVHGYSLEDGIAEALRARGAVVHRRLGPEVIRTLQEVTAPGGGPDASADGRVRQEAGDRSGCPPVSGRRTEPHAHRPRSHSTPILPHGAREEDIHDLRISSGRKSP
jgi:hypothetical protein